MTRVILARHGQTEWNRVERFRGRADLALDEVGLRQAEALAGRVVGCWPVAALYSSPLRRALMTAQPLAQRLGIPVQPADGLLDIDYGRWQGLSLEEVRRENTALYRDWLERPQRARFPGGEGLEEVRLRVVAAVEMAAAEHGGGMVVFVSHKVVCMVLLCAMLGLDNSHFWQIGQDVCALNVFEVEDGEARVTLVNDTCHLGNLA